MGGAASPDPRSQLRAVAIVSRLSATVGYNLTSVLLAVGLGVYVGGVPGRPAVVATAGYAVATMLAKLQASVADCIHDRAVDAGNPEKSVIADAVMTLGLHRAWLLWAGYLAASLSAFAAVASVVGGWALAVGVAVVVLGFTYSYPPRFKERGIWNHVVTTGVDAGLLVLPVVVIVGGRVAPTALVAVVVVACYSFGYHVLHQAADVHFDRQAGVRTFATEAGVPRAVAVAAVASGASAGFVLALGYAVVAIVLAGLTLFYLDLFDSVRTLDPEVASLELSRRFSIAWVATLANGSLAAAVWRRVLGTPIGDAVAALF